jgi:DNA-3-methyladenine glycosylase II
VDGKNKVTVNNVVVGLSNAKASYIQSLTEHFLDTSLLKDVDFDRLSDEDLCVKLKAVKGLGEWSVHMFMIFYLHRQDVFPVGEYTTTTVLSNF